MLNIKNRTGYQYFNSLIRPEQRQVGTLSGSEGHRDPSSGGVAVQTAPAAVAEDRAPMLSNYFFSALAGTTWYMQFFFYSMGESKMGKFGFASWTLHMASIIIFSTMWGWILHEWKGSSRKAHTLIAIGIATLILSTVIIGYGTLLSSGQTLREILQMMFSPN